MVRRLDWILASGTVIAAALSTAVAARMGEATAFLLPMLGAVALAAVLLLRLWQGVLFLFSATLAVVAYAPAIGATEENLLFGIPLYSEVWGGMTPLEMALAVVLGMALLLRHRMAGLPRRTWLAAGFVMFTLLTAVAFLRGHGSAAMTELRLLIPLFMSFAVGWLLPAEDRTLRWIRIGLLTGVLAGGIRAVLFHGMHLGFHYGEFLRVSVDTGDFLFQTFALVWLFTAWLVGGKRWAILLLPFAVATIVFSFARGAWVVALCALAAVAIVSLRWGRGKARRIAWALPFAFAAVLLVAGVSGERRHMQDRIQTVLDWRDHDPNVYRLIETRNAVLSIRERPWFGGGLGARYKAEVALRRSAHTAITTLVHSNVLWLGLKGGLSLAASFVLVLGAALWVSMRRGLGEVSAESRFWYTATFGLLAGYAVLSFAGALLQHVRDNVLLGLLLGLLAQGWPARSTPAPRSDAE